MDATAIRSSVFLKFYGIIVTIPSKLRGRVLQILHEGHPGIVKTLARNYVWWVGMNENIETIVMNAMHIS